MRRDPRPHGVAWWIWALGLAAAALRTTNPVLLLALGTVAIMVAVARRSGAPWGGSITTFIRVAVIVMVLRVILQVVFGQQIPGHVIVTLPSVPLPAWAEGVSIGGPVTVEGLLTALVGGLRLGVVLICFGAANSLASPREVLRSLPGALHEVAVAITVALCFAPEIIAAVLRVRAARRLRGRPTRGLAGLRGIAVPVLEDALEHSLQLASSMGARGFGRRPAVVAPRRERLAIVGVVLGSLMVLIGGYGMLASSSSVPAAGWVGILGAVVATGGVAFSGRRSARTRYRPAPFGIRSLLCALSGWTAVVVMSVVASVSPGTINFSAYPLTWPSLPAGVLLGVAAGLAPLLVAPRMSDERLGEPIGTMAVMS
jgi:energy-coupling factor transport system permease protein